jgi:hypothetical protein
MISVLLLKEEKCFYTVIIHSELQLKDLSWSIVLIITH